MRELSNQRQQLIDAALVAVYKAGRQQTIVALETEVDRLQLAFPDSGMSAAEVRDVLSKLATDHRLTVAFG